MWCACMDFTVKVLAAAALGLHWSNITVLLYEITLWLHYGYVRASLVAESVKNLPAMQETRVRSLGWEDPLEKEMATHSSILTWRIPWAEELGRLQSMGSQESGRT